MRTLPALALVILACISAAPAVPAPDPPAVSTNAWRAHCRGPAFTLTVVGSRRPGHPLGFYNRPARCVLATAGR